MAKKTTELVLLFYKKTTKLVFFCPNIGQLCFKVLFQNNFIHFCAILCYYFFFFCFLALSLLSATFSRRNKWTILSWKLMNCDTWVFVCGNFSKKIIKSDAKVLIFYLFINCLKNGQHNFVSRNKTFFGCFVWTYTKSKWLLNNSLRVYSVIRHKTFRFKKFKLFGSMTSWKVYIHGSFCIHIVRKGLSFSQ